MEFVVNSFLGRGRPLQFAGDPIPLEPPRAPSPRSEEHTSELQSLEIGRAHSELQSLVNLVCRLLLEKKKPNSLTTFLLNDPLAMIHHT